MPRDHPELPTRVLVIFSLTLPWLLILAVAVGMEAWGDWRRVEVQGVVRDTRVVFDDKPHAKNVARWCKEWLVDHAGHRQWLRVARYHTEAEVQTAGDVGKTTQVWYGPDGLSDFEPRPLSNTLSAGWLTVMGTAGLVSVYALARRVLPRRG